MLVWLSGIFSSLRTDSNALQGMIANELMVPLLSYFSLSKSRSEYVHRTSSLEPYIVWFWLKANLLYFLVRIPLIKMQVNGLMKSTAECEFLKDTKVLTKVKDQYSRPSRNVLWAKTGGHGPSSLLSWDWGQEAVFPTHNCCKYIISSSGLGSHLENGGFALVVFFLKS